MALNKNVQGHDFLRFWVPMPRRTSRTLAITALLCAFAVAYADQLTAFPTLSVADGRSTTTITADVRDSSGKRVADGTRVVFNTTLGSFRESIVTTTNGYARAILVSGATAGVAKITATPLSGGSSPSTLEFEFVGDRSLLSSAREYIEIVAPGVMQYTTDSQLIGASGANKGVTVHYRDISVEADDLQLSIGSYELRARKARLHIGKFTKEFDELYLKLNQRRGYGTTTFRAHPPQTVIMQGKWLAFGVEKDDGSVPVELPPEQDRYGLVEIKGPEITPALTVAPESNFKFEDLAGAPSRISAKKAIVFPNKQIQFQKADLYVADTHIMRLPLYQLSMEDASSSPIITEQLVKVQDNQLAVNYPYFLSLKPGQTSLLRFRTADTYGTGLTTSTGAYLDYELNWNRGDDMQGAFAVRGIGRDDYRLSFQQYFRLSDRSSASGMVEMPAGKSLFGSLGFNQQFNGYQASLFGSATKSLTQQLVLDKNGKPTRDYVNTSDYGLAIDRDPTKIGHSPFNFTYGLAASSNFNSQFGGQQSAGLRTRLYSTPMRLDPSTTYTSSLTVSALQGENVVPLTVGASSTLSKRFGKAVSMLLTYDFLHDGYSDRQIGMHRLSAQTFFNAGRFGAHFYASKSLDVDRLSLLSDMEFKLGGLWRLSGTYTFDHYASRYLGSTGQSILNSIDYLDYTVAIGYKLGWREVGLTWSKRTNRIGIQLVNAAID